MSDVAIKVFIDTDIGDDIDDAIALAYALANPRFEVLGVTTVGHCAQDRLRIVNRLADLSGKHFPFAAGREPKSTGAAQAAKASVAWTGRSDVRTIGRGRCAVAA